jgi:hypothetical protein
MSYPPFVGVPLFARGYREAIYLSLGISKLNTISGFEEPMFRHRGILGED